jgi:hypothetical protein
MLMQMCRSHVPFCPWPPMDCMGMVPWRYDACIAPAVWLFQNQATASVARKPIRAIHDAETSWGWNERKNFKETELTIDDSPALSQDG